MSVKMSFQAVLLRATLTRTIMLYLIMKLLLFLPSAPCTFSHTSCILCNIRISTVYFASHIPQEMVKNTTHQSHICQIGFYPQT